MPKTLTRRPITALGLLGLATLVAAGVSLFLTVREPKRDTPTITGALGGARLQVGF